MDYEEWMVENTELWNFICIYIVFDVVVQLIVWYFLFRFTDRKLADYDVMTQTNLFS